MGGAFRVTRGLWERYGDDRVIDTSLAEAAIVGCAIGLALEGLRPIVELQFADFISCAYDQIVTEAAKLHYRWGVPVPIVIRAPAGAGGGAGPFHSQSPEAVFAHIPGLKVVCPATVQDAYDLLRAAVRDPNPVLYSSTRPCTAGAGPFSTGPNATGGWRRRRSGGEATVSPW
jgi:pyruvate/2-oxoglutarate/acetoin dehydrogenase E1 component